MIWPFSKTISWIISPLTNFTKILGNPFCGFFGGRRLATLESTCCCFRFFSCCWLHVIGNRGEHGAESGLRKGKRQRNQLRKRRARTSNQNWNGRDVDVDAEAILPHLLSLSWAPKPRERERQNEHHREPLRWIHKAEPKPYRKLWSHGTNWAGNSMEYGSMGIGSGSGRYL